MKVNLKKMLKQPVLRTNNLKLINNMWRLTYAGK